MTTKGPLLITGAKTDQVYDAPEDQPVLNLNYRHFTHKVGPFDIIGTWLFLDKRRDPCLVLLRHAKTRHKPVPCIVPLASASKWAEPSMADPRAIQLEDEHYAIAMACEFATHLGLNPFRDKDVLSILSAVRSRLEDLIRIPPAPPVKRVLVGDVRFRTTDGTNIEKEVWENAR